MYLSFPLGVKVNQLDQIMCLNQKVKYSINLLIFILLGFVGENITVTDRCVIGACCSVNGMESLAPGTIVIGQDHKRWIRQNTMVCQLFL